jgi:hypothetical protein
MPWTGRDALLLGKLAHALAGRRRRAGPSGCSPRSCTFPRAGSATSCVVRYCAITRFPTSVAPARRPTARFPSPTCWSRCATAASCCARTASGARSCRGSPTPTTMAGGAWACTAFCARFSTRTRRRGLSPGIGARSRMPPSCLGSSAEGWCCPVLAGTSQRPNCGRSARQGAPTSSPRCRRGVPSGGCRATWPSPTMTTSSSSTSTTC